MHLSLYGRDADSYLHVLITGEAVKIHGPFRGIVLIVFRLFRCNFLSKQRVDPVPRKKNHEV